MKDETKPAARILVVDDEPNICEAIQEALERVGYSVAIAGNGAGAMEKMRDQMFDLVICDIKMPDMDGLQLLEQIKENHLNLPVIMITGYASIDSAIASMRKGAHDYISKPFKPDQIRLVVEKTLKQQSLIEETAYLWGELKSLYGRSVIVGKSQAAREVFGLARKVAETNSSVLVTGESGTGKEVLARFIHLNSGRANKAFVTVNCAAIPENLLESELFGHKKGAFTGAIYNKKGSFEIAIGGTIFLDEIAELKAEMQAKILRVLEEREIKRVGSEESLRVDVRVIAASNKQLEDEVRAGRFRDDLYYRLNVVQIVAPPLSRRKEDIPVLARHFLKIYREEMKKNIIDFSDETITALAAYHWPGNIRELKNVVERAVILTPNNGYVRRKHLPQPMLTQIKEAEDNVGSDETLNHLLPLEEIEQQYIEKVLQLCGGNKIKAAKILCITPVTIWRKVRKLNSFG
ncbi:MAG: sigma-54-dependent Fis family transcriptional regulator [Acidobacteria bacterium]|nr:sigma-54-dependent Fis family transcriptional regulator [Acidobacteriota bacterium]MBI3658836.1 sigma-54-dependent Fis family transcriptional regulator [Acidobacteriota bacterium]